jgi:hypothetical protein
MLLLPAWLFTPFGSFLSPKSLLAQANPPNPIVLENQNPGTTAWRVTGTISNDFTQAIKGYASATSVNHGSSINLHISVNPAQSYSIDVYRLGWYNGAGGRLIQHIGPLNGTPQPVCPISAQTGLIECNWAVAYTLSIPTSWTTGIYLAKLINTQGIQSYIPFTVRDDDRVADFLYQQPVLTYQAYNSYPKDSATGKSLYDSGSYGALTALGTLRAVKVSFDRPYHGHGATQLLDESWWERHFISWAERMGYDIS